MEVTFRASGKLEEALKSYSDQDLQNLITVLLEKEFLDKNNDSLLSLVLSRLDRVSTTPSPISMHFDIPDIDDGEDIVFDDDEINF